MSILNARILIFWARRIKTDCNLDVTQHSHALQDVIWSTAVQHGGRNKIVHKSLDNLNVQGTRPRPDAAFDRALIQAIYAERGRKKFSREIGVFLPQFRGRATGRGQALCQ